jgi:hypothetical protein
LTIGGLGALKRAESRRLAARPVLHCIPDSNECCLPIASAFELAPEAVLSVIQVLETTSALLQGMFSS